MEPGNNKMTLQRKRKTKDPCPSCFLHKERCICAFIPKINIPHRLCLIIHAKELKRTTNSGQLAVKSLVNSEIRIRGEKGASQTGLDLSDLLTDDYRTLLFYPCDEAVELTAEFIAQDPRPIQLLVPDGNWRQASKVHYRHQELKNIPRVMIKTPNRATLHLRAESTPEGMSTLEAIAQAMGIIAGSEVGEALLRLYRLKLEKTLMGRGVLPENNP